MSTLHTRPSASVTTAFGKRLRKAREAANLPLDHAAVRVDDLLAGDGPSRETLRRFESGAVPESDIKAMVLAAMAVVYGVDLKTLSPSAADRLDHQSALIHPKPRSRRQTTIGRYATAAA